MNMATKKTLDDHIISYKKLMNDISREVSKTSTRDNNFFQVCATLTMEIIKFISFFDYCINF